MIDTVLKNEAYAVNEARSLPHNSDMSHLDILLPFALPPPELAKDLLRELKTPALASMIARAKQISSVSLDEFSRALPHEIWMANRFGIESTSPAICSPAVAVANMEFHDLSPSEGVWFMLQPAHIQIGRDSLVLTDARQLPLSEQESRALFDAICPLFEEAGKSVRYGDAQTWFVRADDWHALQTTTPDAACGQNIDSWMPKGAGEREWRKLLNELQMHWHVHPVNAEREARNQKPVNSIWLWGGASTNTRIKPAPELTAFNFSGWWRGLGQFAVNSIPRADTGEVIEARAKQGLLLHDVLIEAALAGEWGVWLEQMHRLEAELFVPLLAAIQAKTIAQTSLILTNGSSLSEFCVNKNSLRKFWVRPSLNRLLP